MVSVVTMAGGVDSGEEVEVETVTKEEFDERVNSYRERQGVLDIQRYERADKPYFLNSIIGYHAKREKHDTEVKERICAQVEWVVDSVMIPKLKDTAKYACQSLPCGSAYEGVKVGVPNEFDFIFEALDRSLTAAGLEIKVTNPDTFHTTRSVSERSYFRVKFRGEVPAQWQSLMKCKECTKADECSEDHEDRYLCSRAVQNDFADTIRQVLNRLPQKLSSTSKTQKLRDESANADTRRVYVGRSGPAANIFLSSSLLEDPGIIKVDFTFAIPLQRQCPYSWPLATCDGLVLHDRILGEYQGIDKCYLVPAGDFWRLSFVPHEKALMLRLAEKKYKRRTLLALKSFRDKLSITDDYEKSLLSSYPLKVSFLKENHAGADLSWDKPHLADRALGILSRVEREGQTGNLTSFYIPDDPIQPGENTAAAFVETRRMVRELKHYTSLYYQHGLVHLIFLVAFFLSQVASVVTSSFMAVKCGQHPCHFHNATRGLTPVMHCDETLLARESVTLLVVSFASLFWPLVGLLWISSSMRFTDLYQIFKHINRLYRVAFVVEMIHAALAVTTLTFRVKMMGLFQEIEEGAKSLNDFEANIVQLLSYIHVLAYMSIGLSVVVCTVLIVHAAMVCVCGSESCRAYAYPKQVCSRMYCLFEVIFFDGIYTRACRRRKGSGPLDKVNMMI